MMKLTVFNGTDEHLSFSRWSGKATPGSKSPSDAPLLGESDLAVPPHASATTTVPKKSLKFILKPLESEEGKTASTIVASLQAHLSTKLGAKWKCVRTASDFPWRIYSSKVCFHGVSISVEDDCNSLYFCCCIGFQETLQAERVHAEELGKFPVGNAGFASPFLSSSPRYVLRIYCKGT